MVLLSRYIIRSLQGVAQVAMAEEMKTHRIRDLGFDSYAIFPGNGVNNRHVKNRKWKGPT